MIQNRESFLAEIARQLGREPRTVPEAMPTPVNDYASTRFADLTKPELVDIFVEAAVNTMYAKCTRTSVEDAPETVSKIISKYGAPLFLADDPRLAELGITQRVTKDYPEHAFWSNENNAESREYATKAKSSVVYADYSIADCGFFVMFHDDKHGRTTSLLPENSIVVMRRSQMLPRVAQLAQILHTKAQMGERMPSGISIIGGPSSTADIELIKVIGVHGPLTCEYVIVED